jgi:hypothetical protein
MEAMREAWTDERLDELTERMEKDFRRVDERFDQTEQQAERHFKELDQRLERIEVRVDQGFGRMDTRFDSLHQGMFLVAGGLVSAFLVGAVGVIINQL